MPKRRMNIAKQERFAEVPRAQIQRSVVNRSHGHKTTIKNGFLPPVFVDEVLPGDTWSCNMSVFARLATPLHPIMDNIVLESFFFFVPNRLVWDNWQKFMGEKERPDDPEFAAEVPQAVCGVDGFPVDSLADFFGLPVGIANVSVCAFPFRGYDLIWNEWFRDQNLQNPIPVPKDDGPDTCTLSLPGKRGKRHDYFTSSLPWPQKGEAVTLPLTGDAPLMGATEQVYGTGGNASPTFKYGNMDNEKLHQDIGTVTVAPDAQNPNTELDWADPNLRVELTGSGAYADMSQVTATTINELREAFQLQRLYERDARGGTRYVEQLKSHFGVTSPDFRLQRPEYLGGGTFPVNVLPVAQTSETSAQSPQGNLAAFGVCTGQGGAWTKSFVEHGWIIGMIATRGDITYQQGVNRMWDRKRRWDYYYPALAHLGEQAVKSSEIYFDGSPDDDTVWGYQERWAEYRYKPSLVTARMRSSHAESLDTWHLAYDFDQRPLLNSTFMYEDAPIDRVVAVQGDYPHFLVDLWFNCQVARPMPTYSVPGLIDHF